MKGINSNSKRIQFFKDKIKHRLTELRPYMSDVKYRMYMSVIGDCKDLDELREMAEMDLQFNMVKYLNELTDKIKLSDTSIDELEAVINQNARAAKLTVIMPKKREKQTYEEVVENIDEVLEDKDVLEASANILWQRLSSPVPEDIDITNLEEYEEDDLEVENEETTNIDEIDEYDDAALEEAYEEEEEEDLFEIDEIDEYDDAALEEAYEEEEYLDGLDEIEDIDEEEDDTSEDIDLEDNTLEDEEDKPIDFGDTQEEEEPIDFGDSTVKETEENEEDSFGLDSLDISDMYSLGEETDDEEDDDELINIDDLLDEDSQAYDPDDDYAMDEDDDDEEDDLNIDDMYGDDEDEEEEDDIEEEEEDEYDEYDDYANEEDTEEADEDEDEDELDPDDMFGDDEEDEEEEEDTEDDDLNPDDMFGDEEEEEDAFDIDESELTGDIDDTDSDLDNLFDTTQSTTNNKNIQPQKRAKTQDKVFINGTQRGKQTQDMFNMIFGLANKISKVKNIRR